MPALQLSQYLPYSDFGAFAAAFAATFVEVASVAKAFAAASERPADHLALVGQQAALADPASPPAPPSVVQQLALADLPVAQVDPASVGSASSFVVVAVGSYFSVAI